ncbi:hypothetical protein GCM10010228_44780 [Streptomyces massasporeus]|nr:hypothetical protein GCM10010228_44780 [Streptomyces massasporeus]
MGTDEGGFLESEPTRGGRGAAALPEGEGLADNVFDVDVAWEAATRSRERDDASGEAQALTVLGQALDEAGRSDEADYLHRRAHDVAPDATVRLIQAELLMQRGFELKRYGGDPDTAWGEWFGKEEREAEIVRRREKALSDAQSAFRQAGRIFRTVGLRERGDDAARRAHELMPSRFRHFSWYLQVLQPYTEEVDVNGDSGNAAPTAPDPAEPPTPVPPQAPPVPRSRLPEERADGGTEYPGGAHAAPGSLFEEILVGFLAVKFLGPFLEAFAGKIGEQFGESAVRALGRIRVTRKHDTDSRNLEIDDSDTGIPTVLVLPEDFTEEAQLALIDLDVTAGEVRGTTLRWNPDTAAWEPVEDDQDS